MVKYEQVVISYTSLMKFISYDIIKPPSLNSSLTVENTACKESWRSMKWLLFLFVIFIVNINAQQTDMKSFFVSANFGINDIAADNFSKVYDSNLGFSPAISLGLPISTRTYLYAKASYFFKNGVPYTTTYGYQNGQWGVISEVRNGTATFRQLLLHAGLLTKIFLSPEYTIGIDGGLTFISQIEKGSSTDGTLHTTVSSDGFMGFFGGLMIERNFRASPFSIIGDVQYNYSIGGALKPIGNYGGFNAGIGIRYYFNERRVE
jgi:hypothetical protein